VPVLSVLAMLAVSAADRDARWLKGLRAWWGVPLLLVIVGPWLYAINRATGGAFLQESVGRDLFGKLIGGEEAHGAPPLTHLLILMAGFWPATFFLGRIVAQAWRDRRATAARFLIAWAVPFWILIELVPTKLPQYLLPVYPALALMIGRAILAVGEEGFASWRKLDRGVIVLWLLVGLGLAAALALAPLRYGPGALGAGIVAALAATYYSLRIARSAWRDFLPSHATRAAVMALLIFAVAFEFVAPDLDLLWLSRSAAALVKSAGPPTNTPLAVAGDAEPSLVFLLGTDTKLISGGAAAAYLAANPEARALVETRSESEFATELAARSLVPRALGAVAGLDYSNGHNMRLTLYSSAPK